jgi:iron complex transport system substrate-binding protein
MVDQRIVSLLPGATEIVSSLGFKEGLVGRSPECDFPPGIAHLPVCTEPKFNPQGSSRDIDLRVKALLEEALSVYRLHADLLRRLKPGRIVTQSQCEVCAVSETDLIDVVGSWVDSRPQLVSLNPETLEGIYSYIMWVGVTLDARGAGRATQSRA